MSYSKMRALVSVSILLLLLGTKLVGQESPLPKSDAISGGTKLEDAVKTLHHYGYKNETAFSWAKVDPDASYRWFVLDDGVVLAIIYSDSKKTVQSMQVIFLPPEKAARNTDQLIGIRSVRFHDDGSYALHFEKRAK